jgi:putative endonuclease
MKRFSSNTQKIGKVGEDLACRFLRSKGFNIIERNYTKKWGEIDIVARKSKKYYFCEVKTVSRETMHDFSCETYRPEENVSPSKLKRIHKTIGTYLAEEKIPESTDWQIDVIAIFLGIRDKTARIRVLPNVIM